MVTRITSLRFRCTHMRLRYTLAQPPTVSNNLLHFLTLHCFSSPLAQNIGCFKDTSRRAIPQLDGKSRLIRGNYKRRKFAIQNCILAAVQRGYRMIGVQDGGWCASGPQAQRTFLRYAKEFLSDEGLTPERAAFWLSFTSSYAFILAYLQMVMFT